MDELGVKSSASLYVSTGNLVQSSFTSKQQSEPLTRQEAETQRKHVKIVEQLLNDFDMEKTEDKYRNQNVVEVVLDSNNMRYDLGMSTLKIRQRLRQLMGTDVIRLNDKRYMEKLSRKLKEEYENKMDRKEKQLEQAEVERLRKLMLEGVIPRETKNKNKKGKHHQKKNQHPQNNSEPPEHKKVAREDKSIPASSTKDNNEDKLINKAGTDEEVITQIQIIEQKDFEEKDETIYNEEDNSIKKDVTRVKSEETPRKETKQKQTKDRKDHHKGEIVLRSDESSISSSRLGTPKTGKYSKVESQLIRQLRKAQTVDELYEIAEKVVNME